MDPVELLKARRLSVIKQQVSAINQAISENSPWSKGTWLNTKLTKAVEAALYLLMEVMNVQEVDDRLVRLTDFIGGEDNEGNYHVTLQDSRLRLWYNGENVDIVDLSVKVLLPNEDPRLRARFKWSSGDTTQTLYDAFCDVLSALEDTTLIQHSIAFTGFCTPFLSDCKLIVTTEKVSDVPNTLRAEFFNEAANTYVVCTLFCKAMFDTLDTLIREDIKSKGGKRR